MADNILMTLPIRLKQVRKSLRKSQKEMAEYIDISFQAWQGYEVGKNEPGSKVIEALTKIGFNANWLLTGKGEMKLPPLGRDLDIIAKSLILSINVVMEYQDGLQEKMSPGKHNRLMYILYEILSEQNIEWQTKEKAKMILEALLKISENFEIFRRLNMGTESRVAFLAFLENPDALNINTKKSEEDAKKP
jgi:transcriptional regulator with XRE-family HTH domain